LRIRDFFHLAYESQIRASFVLFVLFLILFNFGTEYLFYQTRQAFKREIQRNLSTVATSASLIWEQSPQSAGSVGSTLKKNLLELSFKSGVSRISFLSSDGAPLISSKEILSAEDFHIFWGVKPELVNQIRGQDGNERTGSFFSEFYSDSSGNTYFSCYLPLESPVNLTGQKTESRTWVMVEKEVSAFASIEKMSMVNVLAQAGALFIAAFVTLALIKNLLRPYRLIVKKAKSEKIILKLEESRNEGELDVAVGIFEQVIKELKEKEKTLQKLYQKTDRKAKDLESYNEYILKSMTSGMIICNNKGEIIQMNQPAETMLDLSKSQVKGRYYKTVFEEESPLQLSIQTALAERRVFSIPETKLSKKIGESIWLSLNSTPIKDEKGNMLGVVVFLNDFTEIKKLEQEIAFKDKMATLGEMSSGLAHELRNSMGAILGFSKLLKKRKADPISQNQTIEEIVSEAMCMESMLKRFLTFAKPFEPKIEKIDIKEIIQECYAPVKEVLKENKITFELDAEPDLPPIWGDRLLLRQCFQNLIQNSIEAMPNGGKLYIRLKEERPGSKEESILMEFFDTGCGIAKEVQDKVFNPFFTSKEKGTGLGLSLVKKIVSLHNGRIELESELQRGTTFKIFLPLKAYSSETDLYSAEFVPTLASSIRTTN
jgi:two-component system, sporulation sensor kinase E